MSIAHDDGPYLSYCYQMSSLVNEAPKTHRELTISQSTFFAALILSAIQFMLGVGMVDSLLSTCVFALLTLSGVAVWQLVKNGPIETFFEFVGLGFPIGASLSAIIILIIRTLGFLTLPTWICALILPALVLPTLLIKNRKIQFSSAKTKEHELLIFGLIPVLYLASWSKYTLISLGCLLAAMLLRHTFLTTVITRNSKYPSILIFFSLAVALLFAIATNKFFNGYDTSLANLAQTAGSDVIHDAAQSFGFIRYGFSDFVGQTGTKNNGYPLAYMVGGIFADLANAPRLQMVAISVQIFSLFSIFSLAISLIRKFINPNTSVWILAVLLLMQASYPSPFLLGEYPKVNNLLGLAMLLTSLYILIQNWTNFRFVRLPFIYFLFTLLIFTKPHHALALLMIVGFDLMYSLRKHWFARPTTQLLSLVLLMILSYFGWSRLIYRVESVVAPISFDFSYYWFFVGVISIICRGYIFQFSTSHNHDLAKRLRANSFLVLCSAGLITAVLNGINNFNYLISAGLFLVAIANTESIERKLSLFYTASRIRTVIVVAVGIFAGFLLYIGYAFVNLHMTRTGDNSILRYLFGQNVEFVPVVVLTFLSIIGAIYWTYSQHESSVIRNSILSLLLIVSVSLNFGLFYGNLLVQPIKISFYKLNESRNDFLRDDIVAAAIWLEANSDVDDIIATNTLCPVSVKPGDATPANFGKDPYGMECYERNTNLLVAGIASRRTLLEAPIYGPSGFTLKDETALRYNLVRGFTLSPSFDLLTKLRDYDVSWILIDRQLTPFDQWETFGLVGFETGQVTVLFISEVGTI
jgi:hypothetical protein